jgi:hypothetical protein
VGCYARCHRVSFASVAAGQAGAPVLVCETLLKVGRVLRRERVGCLEVCGRKVKARRCMVFLKFGFDRKVTSYPCSLHFFADTSKTSFNLSYVGPSPFYAEPSPFSPRARISSVFLFTASTCRCVAVGTSQRNRAREDMYKLSKMSAELASLLILGLAQLRLRRRNAAARSDWPPTKAWSSSPPQE